MAQRSRRNDLIDRGLDLVHERGFGGSGVAAIAEASGAPKGSFYNHFKSKDAFGDEILARYFADVRATLDEVLADEERPTRERLRIYFTRLRAYNEGSGFARGCLIGNFSAEASSVSEATRALLERLLAEWSEAIAACLEEGVRAGDVAPVAPPEELARLLLDCWQGALLRAKVERSGAALDRFIDVLLPELIGRDPSGRGERA